MDMLDEKVLAACSAADSLFKMERLRAGIERGVPFYEWAIGKRFSIKEDDARKLIDECAGDIVRVLTVLNGSFARVGGIGSLAIGFALDKNDLPLFVFIPKP